MIKYYFGNEGTVEVNVKDLIVPTTLRKSIVKLQYWAAKKILNNSFKTYIVINKNNEVLDGKIRVSAAKIVGWEKIRVKVLTETEFEEMMCKRNKLNESLKA